MPLRCVALAALLVLGVPASVGAIEGGSVSSDLSFNGTGRNPNNPRTGALSCTVTGALELTDRVAAELSLGATASLPTRAVAGESFGARGGTVLTLAPAFDFQLSDHFYLGLSGFVSPKSTLRADSQMSFEALNVPVAADVLLESKTASQGLHLLAGFDTDGESNLETSIAAGVAAMHLATEQRILAVRGPAGREFKTEDILTYCATHVCTRQMVALLESVGAADLWQLGLSLSLIETLFQSTEVGLSFSYFLYDHDPTEVGYFSLASVGRSSVSFGDGVPLAPMHWSLRPEASHRFGNLQLRVWYQRTRYVADEGHGDVVGLKAQYRLSKSWRLSLTASGAQEKDAEGNGSRAGTVAVGVKWRF
ncbi:MAG: hypothetical protein HY901_22485 [Deltaproteobacteria bacterium]|nr:hypothetical protein [Deltaproteobacteria bacterium]